MTSIRRVVRARPATAVDRIGVTLPPGLLTPEEEIELARAIEAGVLAAEARRVGTSLASAAELLALERLGQRAARRFVECNLRLVAMVTRREAARSGMGEGDLFQEGCLGLIEAVQRFDHQRGLRFATYALYWIRAYVGAMTANRAGELNLPAGRAEVVRELRGAQAMLCQQRGRDVSAAELAATLGRDPDWVARLLSYGLTRSLDDRDFTAVDVVDESAAEEFERILRGAIPGREVLAGLSVDERRVIELRYGFADGREHSSSDVARLLGLTRSRARRLEQRALERLRDVYPQQASVHLWS